MASAVLPSAAYPPPENLVPNTVLRVFGVPRQRGTVSRHEFQHELSIVAAGEGRKRALRPGEDGYIRSQREALRALIEPIWLYGLGVEMGIRVTPRQVSRSVAALKEENFRSETEWRHFLREARYTKRDVRQVVESQLLSQRLQDRLKRKFSRETNTAAEERQAFEGFVTEFNERWRSRTVCAPAFAIDNCSNGPLPS